MNDFPFASLVGLTFSSVAYNSLSDNIVFTTTEGREFVMHHVEDCCESVGVEDVCGDMDWLIGSPILTAEESSNSDDPAKSEWDESYTWTFYRISTAKGMVVIRWYGSSNGYYSESVSFVERVS